MTGLVWPNGQNLTDMNNQEITNVENKVDEMGQPLQDAFQDSLLDALVSLTRFHHKPCTAESLIAGLPLDSGKLNPDLFVRAAEGAGFLSKHAEISISDISKLVLPVVLCLKNSKATILLDVKEDHALILQPGEGEKEIDLKELESTYIGRCLYCKPLPSSSEVDELE